jgi:cell wall-associated NlpC family hydrolase
LSITSFPENESQAMALGRLAPGDLVFFDADSTDGTQIDHVGIYLGRDTGGNYRFLSSRQSIDGPTMGDYRGSSVLNGTGLYARSFRAARRL